MDYNKLFECYNEAYKSHLNNISPSIFLSIFIKDIIKLINCTCGIILKYNKNDNFHNLSIITHAFNDSKKHITVDDNLHIFSKYISKANIPSSCLLMQSIINTTIISKPECSFYELVGDNLMDHNPSIVLIPCVFNSFGNGVILICNEDLNLIPSTLEPIKYMTGALINDIPINFGSLSHQLLLDAFNNINEAFVITDKDMKIIYKNEYFLQIITNYFSINEESIPDFLIDIIPQTISLMSDNNVTDMNTNFFTNKKITIDISDQTNIDIIINSISSCGGFYHVCKLSDIKSNENITNNSKNLVAYLSHELRNPIQAISTGIYVMNRSINKIDEPVKCNHNDHSNHSNHDTQIDHIDQDLHLSESNESNESNESSESIESIISVNNIKSPESNRSDKSNGSGENNLCTIKSIMRRVDSACNNMNIIIDDILDLSKINNDEMIMNLDEYEIREITDMICDEFTEQAAKKSLKFDYVIHDSVPKIIYTDNTRLFQIISNLISNAIKYSNTGTIKFEVFHDPTLNNIIFKISDQGKGIRKVELCNLFKKYGRTSNSTTDVNSNGLGLFVCQKIAHLLGGSIETMSEYKKGSTFSFVHPIKLGYSGIKSNQNVIINKEIKGNVLIVDDDPNITALFKLLLKTMNYDEGFELNIETTNSGEKAIYMTQKKYYHLIFMDIDLDGEDGCSICETIIGSEKTINKKCPIVAVTANIKSIQRDRDVKFNNFHDIILKPFNNKDISKIIIKYMNKARSMPSISSYNNLSLIS